MVLAGLFGVLQEEVHVLDGVEVTDNLRLRLLDRRLELACNPINGIAVEPVDLSNLRRLA